MKHFSLQNSTSTLSYKISVLILCNVVSCQDQDPNLVLTNYLVRGSNYLVNRTIHVVLFFVQVIILFSSGFIFCAQVTVFAQIILLTQDYFRLSKLSSCIYLIYTGYTNFSTQMFMWFKQDIFFTQVTILFMQDKKNLIVVLIT